MARRTAVVIGVHRVEGWIETARKGLHRHRATRRLGERRHGGSSAIQTAMGFAAGVAGSVTRSPATTIRPAARWASNDSREIPAARKRWSTVTTSEPGSATPRSLAPHTDKNLLCGHPVGGSSGRAVSAGRFDGQVRLER